MPKITMKLHAIVISKKSSSEPALYYNGARDKWTKNFQLGCGFVNEEEAKNKLKEIDVEGAYVVNGTAST